MAQHFRTHSWFEHLAAVLFFLVTVALERKNPTFYRINLKFWISNLFASFVGATKTSACIHHFKIVLLCKIFLTGNMYTVYTFLFLIIWVAVVHCHLLAWVWFYVWNSSLDSLISFATVLLSGFNFQTIWIKRRC